MINLRHAAPLEWLYPRTCDGCDRALQAGDRHLCWDCRARFHIVHEPFCQCCGLPVTGTIDHAYACYRCAEQKPAFNAARSAAHYEGPLREAVQRFKYSDGLWLRDDLVTVLEGAVHTVYQVKQFHGVAAVPLYPRRCRERGYNQAAVLARELARRLKIRFYPRVLSRIRDTRSQTRLTSRQRLSNVRGAFQARRGLASIGANWLLIDDVMTTGATVHECAEVMKKAGADAVYVLTLARS